MNSDKYSSEPENDDALLQDEEQDMSSGNRKLGIIVGAVVLLAGLGYAFVPGKTGRAPIASVMPSVMLGDATVTGDRPAEEVAAAEEDDKPEEAKKPTATATVAARPAPRPAATPGTAPTGAVAAQPVAAPVVEEAAPAPAPAPEPTNVTLSGRILDEEGKPMAGATVMLKGSRKVASTDANGNYSMEVPAGDNTLTYGYGGYQDQEMRARGSQPVNVTLVPREGAKRRRK
ncbi:carboxypeptidase-like regulatory domain-containing protein [Hymenobacter algoricola]|uniref:Carboxypeptidase-like regulatory domain-containing protein n=1 Tax=Hymenobacter algoricola TaxID=486267 RepID=A0ABP7MNH5_9BACT